MTCRYELIRSYFTHEIIKSTKQKRTLQLLKSRARNITDIGNYICTERKLKTIIHFSKASINSLNRSVVSKIVRKNNDGEIKTFIFREINRDTYGWFNCSLDANREG